MSLFKVAILGIVHSLTEFLPISSSGHLFLFSRLFNEKDLGLALVAILHLGTFLALIIYFRQTLKQILVSFFSSRGDKKNKSLGVFILIGSLPTLLVGFFLGRFLEQTTNGSVIIAASLIVWGIFLFFAEQFSKRQKQIGKDLTLGRSLIVGLAQVVALIPGTSRSGITLGAGLFTGLEKKKAMEFSFLLGLPAIFLAGLFEAIKLLAFDRSLSMSFWSLLLGLVLSFLVGLLAIKLVFWLVQKTRLFYFVIYRFILGLTILLFFL